MIKFRFVVIQRAETIFEVIAVAIVADTQDPVLYLGRISEIFP